jgi:Asp/Glu/hydantoin racemase
MKIGVVHITTEEASGAYTQLITANLERAKNEATEVMHRYVGHLRRATDTAQAYPTMLNKVDIVAEMVALERDGADAVLVACSGDPGVAEARSLLSIPVVGPMEATFLLACSYGWRFSILTVADRTWSSNMDQMVQALGLAARYAGQRQLHTPTATIFTEGFERPQLVIDDIEARARECVEDGADVIVIGSAGLGTFATNFGVSKVGNPEVPIFDAIATGFKVAELRVELKDRLGIPAVSRAGWHAEFSGDDRRRVNRLFGWVDDSLPVGQ